MSFKSYVRAEALDGSWWFQDPEPLIFSGRRGLIAQYVLARRAETAWHLTPAEIHQLAGLGGDGRARVILFEQTESDELELLELKSVSGVSAARTEMLFSFRPLLQAGRSDGLIAARRAPVERTYTEELVLDGGVSAPDGPWRWRKQHLSLGGVVCGAERVTTGTANL